MRTKPKHVSSVVRADVIRFCEGQADNEKGSRKFAWHRIAQAVDGVLTAEEATLILALVEVAQGLAEHKELLETIRGVRCLASDAAYEDRQRRTGG